MEHPKESDEIVPTNASQEVFDLAREYLDNGLEPDRQFEELLHQIVAKYSWRRVSTDEELRHFESLEPANSSNQREPKPRFQTGAGAMDAWQRKKEDKE